MRHACPLVLTLALAAPAWGQQPRGEITALVYLADGKNVVAASVDDQFHVYDPGTGKVRFAVEAHGGGCWAAALSADGKLLATGGADKRVRLWDTTTWKEVRSFEGHTKPVYAVAFAPDGKTLASGGADRSIRVWDTATAKQLQVWHGHELAVLSLAYAPDGKTLASGGTCTADIPNFIGSCYHSDHVRLWDPATGKQIRQHALHGSTVAFTPDGRGLVAAGCYAKGKQLDRGLMLQGGTLVSLGTPGKDGEAYGLKGVGAFAAQSRDGRLLGLAYGTRKHAGPNSVENEMSHRRVSVVETATGKEVLEFNEERATALAFAPDGQQLAAGFVGGNVQFLDLAPRDQGEPAKLEKKDFDKLWADLAEEVPGPAYKAVWALVAAGEPAAAYLKDKLHAVKAAGDEVAALVKKLGADKYAVREAAYKELVKLGPGAEGDIRKALETETLVETRTRLQKLLASFETGPPAKERLRQARALMVLERVGGADARATLARLADGSPGAWLTVQAELALKRMEGK
jgi:hypothetical protein